MGDGFQRAARAPPWRRCKLTVELEGLTAKVLLWSCRQGCRRARLAAMARRVCGGMLTNSYGVTTGLQ